MTSTKERSGRTFHFVDNAGGALSLLAVGVARSLGFDAVAATFSAPAAAPAELATVLEEVGMRLPDGGAVSVDELDATGREVVYLGGTPPTALTNKPVWDVALYEGAGELERLATARIARDRIERRLKEMQGSLQEITSSAR